tara:strand:- start:42305 stop:42499 length:195 start_codon:yes stop_codon:yes gene_type:complete
MVTGGSDVRWVHPEISNAGNIATQHIMMPFILLPSLTANLQIKSFQKQRKHWIYSDHSISKSGL